MPRITKEREGAIRARILQAGIEAFERDGFRRASMSAIAAAVGLSSGAIYTYFDSKEQLFLQAFAALVAGDDEAVAAAVRSEPSTEGRVRIAIDYFVNVGVAPDAPGIRGVGGGFLVHAWAHADASPLIREQLLHRREQFVRLATFIVEDAVRRGEVPATTDAPALGAGLASMLDGLLVQRAEMGRAFTRDDARRQAFAVVGAILRQ